ncbi:uncharacterized protein si:zfos-911d5.4 isoform X1 [Hypomesus transpacificus]|uniref:uncharacterized protein si:zfos-911d5.4 isoform X1 n=1 Tax=Hypomesus transpacificus TaxID=137520 RepID=UPI001F081C19|nr:uncharacterized protein si:zfos-911d5.4 isoform X1 [Hypomesus transpacificus]
MFTLGSRLAQFHIASGTTASEDTKEENPQPTQTFNEFLQYVRQIGGLKKEDIFCNLRISNSNHPSKDDISVIILTGHGVFCIDVKLWRGTVSAQNQNWHVQLKENDQNLTNTCIERVEDPLKAIMNKTAHLWQYMKRNGVSVRQNLFFPRVVFLASDCELDEELRKKKEMVSHSQMDAFFRSFKEGYVAWISDAMTPSWLTGHLSYRQMGELRVALKRVGTWDLVKLHCGEQLRGDYKGCQYIALNRQDTDMLEFSRVKTLSADSLWALLGHAPQVTVKMYKRGAQGWLGKPLNATTTIPYTTHVIFRVSGEEEDLKILANTICSITLSI